VIQDQEPLALRNNTSRNDMATIINVYMGHFSGPEEMNSPYGKIIYAGSAEEFLLPLDILCSPGFQNRNFYIFNVVYSKYG